jgi:hypothetical protein
VDAGCAARGDEVHVVNGLLGMPRLQPQLILAHLLPPLGRTVGALRILSVENGDGHGSG